jgi:hypothetical protein
VFFFMFLVSRTSRILFFYVLLVCCSIWQLEKCVKDEEVFSSKRTCEEEAL